MKYTVVYWIDDEHREQGLSDVYDSFATSEEAVEEAKRLFRNQDFPAVEVEGDRGMMIYHISVGDDGRTQEEGPYKG